MAGKDAYVEFVRALVSLRDAARDTYYTAEDGISEQIAADVWEDIERFADKMADWNLDVMGWR